MPDPGSTTYIRVVGAFIFAGACIIAAIVYRSWELILFATVAVVFGVTMLRLDR